MSDETSPEALRRLVDGYMVSQALHVAAALGLADLLAEGSCRALRTCRNAIKPAGRLLVIERVVEPPNEGRRRSSPT